MERRRVDQADRSAEPPEAIVNVAQDRSSRKLVEWTALSGAPRTPRADVGGKVGARKRLVTAGSATRNSAPGRIWNRSAGNGRPRHSSPSAKIRSATGPCPGFVDGTGRSGPPRPAHILVIAQQGSRGEDQVVEIEQRCTALVDLEAIQHRPQESGEMRQDARGDGLLQRRPRSAAGRVVIAGAGVQALGIGLGQAREPGRAIPFALLPVGPEASGGGAEIGMGTRDQQPDEIGRPLRRPGGRQRLGHLREERRETSGLRLVGVGTVDESREPLGSIGKPLMSGASASVPRPRMRRLRICPRIPVSLRVSSGSHHHLGQQSAGIAASASRNQLS